MLVPRLGLALAACLAPPALAQSITTDDVRATGRVLAESFDEEEIELMLSDLSERLAAFEALRAPRLANDVAPSLVFVPGGALPHGQARRHGLAVVEPSSPPPADLEELAFADIATLAGYVKFGHVSCEALARMYLARLERIDETLHCVVNLTTGRALAQARRLDEELARGEYRGPLHGIPWVAKDLLAVEGYPTTWGAAPFVERELDGDATVVDRLDEAGAVLIAKVSLGELAWGDTWFGGTTRNPWNPEQGSSGSSAGSAASVVAGGAAFAIGSETLGSIVSPSTRCGASSLRPTFGRVGRGGAMTLCWSLDKLGPMCRSLDDAAIVFDAIHGADPRDAAAVSLPFAAPPRDVEGLRVGFPEEAFRDAEGADERHTHVLEQLEALGVELVPIALPDYPVDAMMIVLAVESGAAFDDFSRGDDDDLLVRQQRRAWPNSFRHARLIPAVDYVRANRLRTLLVAETNALLEEVDAIVHPSFASDLLAITNLTGHPTAVAPCGFRDDGTPWSISFTGGLYDESTLLALAGAWQRASDYHLRHPEF